MSKYTVNTTESTIYLEEVGEIDMRDGMVMFTDSKGGTLLMVSVSHFISAERASDGANT